MAATPGSTPTPGRDTPRSAGTQENAMDIEKEPDGNRTPGRDPSQAAKRQRLSLGGYNVSQTVPPSRDHSPLRRPTAQSKWDCEFTPLAQPPDAFRGWVKQNADKLPYHAEYDEAIYAPVPTGRHANPHLWTTQRGEAPELPLEGHQEFTRGPFPNVQINPWRHVGNIQIAQRQMLEAALGRFLAIIPHGGGRAMNEKRHELAEAYQVILRSFRFQSNDGEGVMVTVFPPDPRNGGNGDGKNEFAPPWPMYVDMIRDTQGLLRNFLLYQQQFAFEPSLSFSVFSMEPDQPRSWKTILLVSSHINPPGATHNDVLAARTAIRAELIKRLERHEPYRELIAQLAAVHIGHTGTRDQVFKTVTDTYHLELTTVDDRQGEPTPAFVLLARPITETRAELEELKYTIMVALCGRKSNRDDDHFYVDARKIRVVNDAEPGPISVDCKLCKSDIHRTADCPLPKSRGWKGIQPKNLGQNVETETPKATPSTWGAQRPILEGVFDRLNTGNRGAGRGKGRGNGKRGRGRRGQNGGNGGKSSNRK